MNEEDQARFKAFDITPSQDTSAAATSIVDYSALPSSPSRYRDHTGKMQKGQTVVLSAAA